MSERHRKPYTVVNFCCDRVALTLRGWFLNEAGYRVLNSSNGFEAIRLSASEEVHAAVLDLDHNRTEVTLIAQEIKRLRPQIVTVVVTERTVPMDGVCELADALVPREHGPETLVKSLQRILAGGV
jgi:DNA-binding response OmpR family regulator